MAAEQCKCRVDELCWCPHPQEHRAGTRARSQRGFWLKMMPSKHLQGCGGRVGSGAQPTSQMSTPRHCPPCCRGHNHWGERQRPAQDRKHSAVSTAHQSGIGSSHNPHTGCWRCTLRSPKSSHQSSSAELEHFYILHLNPTGWKAGITSVSSAPFPSISWLVLESAPLQRHCLTSRHPWHPPTAPTFPSHQGKARLVPTPACADSSSEETFGFT